MIWIPSWRRSTNCCHRCLATRAFGPRKASAVTSAVRQRKIELSLDSDLSVDDGGGPPPASSSKVVLVFGGTGGVGRFVVVRLCIVECLVIVLAEFRAV